MSTTSRTRATQYATLDDARPFGADHGPDSDRPTTVQEIRAAGHPIGYIVHRDYESGYPGRYEVLMYGSRPWSFHDTETDARRGADEFAQALLAPGPHRPREGGFDFRRLPSPVDRAALAATPSLLRPWPSGPEGRARIAAELRTALATRGVDVHRVLYAVADYLTGD